MKTKYTPGTPDGLVGKTFNVEIIGLRLAKVKYNELPLVKEVRIRYENGTTMWVDGMKFYDNTTTNLNIIHNTY